MTYNKKDCTVKGKLNHWTQKFHITNKTNAHNSYYNKKKMYVSKVCYKY